MPFRGSFRCQEQVNFPQSYEYLTIAPAPSDAGAFSAFSAPTLPPPTDALDERELENLVVAMQVAMANGKESPEFGEAKA